MIYSIEVLNASKEKTAELRGVTVARLRERVNGLGVLTAETVEPETAEGITARTSYLRVRRTGESGYGTFRVLEVVAARDRERRSVTLTARHILGDTADEVFADAATCIGHTPAELMDRVLAHSGYGSGTVESTTVVPYVRFEYESVWDCLLRICAVTGGELHLDEENGEVDLLTAVGSDSGAVFRYGLNLAGASRTVDTSRLANRVYGVGGGDPPLTLSGATLSGGNEYAEDAASISVYGTVEAVLHEPTIEAVENLVSTPALDGTYTAGLCEDWTNDGATVSRNTDADSCLYGLVSQRVETAADGQGISQQVSVTSGEVYSVLANVFIDSGTVCVKVEDGVGTYQRPSAVTGSGLTTVRIENWKAIGDTVTVRIVQEGAGSADFSVDSVQLAAGARATAFTAASGADTLWERASECLAAHKAPAVLYDLSVVDSGADYRSAPGSDRFGLGDTVRVEDPGLGLSVTTRVMERTVDLVRPWRMQVKLDSPTRTMADVVTAIRKTQEAGIRHARAIMSAASTAAEVGSSRLGFHALSFRFTGTVTASSWDAVSWTAGTFRAGDCSFAVSSGSITGLEGSSTHYVYFDRTAPTTFGSTTTAADAESSDRILVLAVVTTSSPTLCVIHPLGIISG